jgi:ATP-dependent DNA ligase
MRFPRLHSKQSIERLNAQYTQIESRIETMYMDKLDGRITQEIFDRTAGAKRNDQQALLRKIRSIQSMLVARVEFVEWTQDWHLRHSRFVGLRTAQKKNR